MSALLPASWLLKMQYWKPVRAGSPVQGCNWVLSRENPRNSPLRKLGCSLCTGLQMCLKEYGAMQVLEKELETNHFTLKLTVLWDGSENTKAKKAAFIQISSDPGETSAFYLSPVKCGSSFSHPQPCWSSKSTAKLKNSETLPTKPTLSEQPLQEYQCVDSVDCLDSPQRQHKEWWILYSSFTTNYLWRKLPQCLFSSEKLRSSKSQGLYKQLQNIVTHQLWPYFLITFAAVAHPDSFSGLWRPGLTGEQWLTHTLQPCPGHQALPPPPLTPLLPSTAHPAPPVQHQDHFLEPKAAHGSEGRGLDSHRHVAEASP